MASWFLRRPITLEEDIAVRIIVVIVPIEKMNPINRTKKRVTMSWSGGKDSALALYRILQRDDVEVTCLHTVIGKETKRVGLHGVREDLIDKQAASIGIPLHKLYLPTSNDHDLYKDLMLDFYQDCRSQLIEGVVFGDIFLEDLRQFRISLLKSEGLSAIFPIWKEPSQSLIQEFLDTGFKTLICSANKNYFSRHQVGITIDKSFLHKLPTEVDPCGENGEFHTFVYDGPLFKFPIQFLPGEIIHKTYSYQSKNKDGAIENNMSSFWFQDLFSESTDDMPPVKVGRLV